ncbi:MAG: DUF4405 domain-containing protein [Anaerolineae bacterium]|nr:DUF4405 domain-containing protein [Anaerolineae bacterium]
MDKRPLVSSQTRRNWWIDLFLLVSGLVVLFSSIYFLFWGAGGYQGGRNPYYGAIILFSRETWEWLHTWLGIVMIAAAAIHIPLHWGWIVSMTKRSLNILLGRCERMNAGGQFNLLVNLAIGISALLAAISGMYFFFAAPGSAKDPTIFIFTRLTWDLIHTWSGVVMIAAGILHFAIHWRWVVNVTRKIFKMVLPVSAAKPEFSTETIRRKDAENA